MWWAVALLALEPLLCPAIYSRRRPDLMEENIHSKTTLHALDDNIVEYITKPSDITSKLIFKDIRSYNDNFKEIIEGFEQRKFRFVRIAHVIYDNGGPGFLKLRIDAPILFKVCGWAMSDLGEFYHLLKTTHRLWLDFKKIYEEVRTAVQGNWTQLKVTFQSTEAPQPVYNLTAMFHNILERALADNYNTTSIPYENSTLA